MAKDGGLIRKQPPESVARRKHLYSLPSTHFNEQNSGSPYYNQLITENILLKHIEDEWVNVRDRLNLHSNLGPVIRSLRNFVIIQSLRTPKFLRQNNERIMRVGRTENEIDDAFHFAFAILKLLPVYTENCVCEIVKNTDIKNFITCDNPATHWLQNGREFHHLDGIVLNDDLYRNPNYKILSPIHPKFFAILTPNLGIKVSEADKNNVRFKSNVGNTVDMLNQIVEFGADKMLFAKYVGDFL